MIDTHAHIYTEQFDGDTPQIIENAKIVGVKKILMPNIDESTVDVMLHLEESNPDFCYSMMGLHPCSVGRGVEKQLHFVEDWLAKRSFKAVGEIGTDLYWDKSLFDQQKEAFNIQCDLALKYDLPVVIHCRESINETIELVTPFAEKGLTGVFHCFTGSVNQAKRIKSLGFYLGIGGVLTFKNSGLDKVIAEIGMEKLMLETDSPYLAPTPNRGKRNEPAFLRLVAEKLVMLFPDLSFSKVVEITTGNAQELFKLQPHSENGV